MYTHHCRRRNQRWRRLFPFNTAIECTDDSACNVMDSAINSGKVGVSCINGGCGTFSGNTITTTAGNSSPHNSIWIDNAHPNFHDNEIVAGACWGGGGSSRLVLAEIANSTAVLTNNAFRDQPCPGTMVDFVRLKAGAAITMHNNTFEMETCTGCGAKRGLVLIVPSGGAKVRNNIFANAGTANFVKGFGVYETDGAGSQLVFENNALWTPNGGTLFMQNGTTPLLISAINALQGYAANIEADPMFDATYHLLPGSPCRNAGKTVTMPLVDFDGDTRPQEMSFDIGADEYVQ